MNESKISLQLDDVGEFLAKFAERSDHVYWISSNDFKSIKYISPSYERIWGRRRDELYKNPNLWITFLHPEDAVDHHPIQQMVDRIKSLGDKARYSENYRIIRPNGEIRWIMDNGFPLYDDKGVCFGVSGIAVDITQQKKQYEELYKAKEEADTANRAKDEFIRNMSHDIRTPLSGIIGISSILEQTLNSADEKDYAHMINVSGEQLLTLLNSVLDIIASGSHKENELNLSKFNIQELIQGITDLELPTIKFKNLALKINLAADLPQKIESDFTKLHRILLNLLGNAVKFTEKGGIEIEVKRRKGPRKQHFLEFYIKDTGKGIKAEDQKKVFKKFYRGSSSYQGLYAGHGVGLHIVKKYIHLLKGKVNIESRLRKGTTFLVTIPFTPIEESKHIQASVLITMPQKAERLNVDVSSLKILIVEDNAIALKMLELFLTQKGLSFMSASSGSEAIELFRAYSFNLVLTDIGLPDMTGTKVTRLLRLHEKKMGSNPIPIIGLTAHSITEKEEKYFKAGMNKVYTKPVRPAILDELLEAYFSIRDKVHNTQESSVLDPLIAWEDFSLLDLELGIKNLGSKETLLDMLDLFFKEIKEDLPALQADWKNKNIVNVKHLAHKMKSGALYCGTIRLQKACEFLELGSAVELPHAYKAFCQIAEQTMDTIKAELSV